MKRILLSTAAAALAASSMMTGAYAADDSDMSATNASDQNAANAGAKSGAEPSTKVGDMTIHASKLIGKPVHIRADNAESAENSDNPQNWERVGEIGDVIISKDGQIDSVTIEAGGFLGMNEKHLSTSMEELQFVAMNTETGNNDENTDYVVVFTGDRSALEQRDEVDRQAVRDTGSSFYSEAGWNKQAKSDMDNKTKSDDSASNDGQNMSDSPEQMQTAELSDTERDALTAEDLEGVAIYGPGEEHLGEVSELVLSDDGEITNVVVDVGGFLGMGEKPVALPFEQIALHNKAAASPGDLHATTKFSEEELNSMQRWEG